MKPQKNYPKEVYLNGEWMKPEDAFVSAFDRGFMFGDGIYEVTPFYEGEPFKLKEHLQRLQYCLDEINLEFDAFSLKPVMEEAISRGNFSEEDAAVYIQVTRGVAPRTHFFPEESLKTILLYAFPVNLRGFENNSWKVMASEDRRWLRCDIKSIALLANTMANEVAISSGYKENLLVRNGYFTEGSHTTMFLVKNGIIYTHPEGSLILSGITRKVIINLCRSLDIEVKEVAVHLDELVEVDEIFLTGTTTQVVPVELIEMEGKEVFIAQGNRITSRLQQEFLKITRGL